MGALATAALVEQFRDASKSVNEKNGGVTFSLLAGQHTNVALRFAALWLYSGIRSAVVIGRPLRICAEKNPGTIKEFFTLGICRTGHGRQIVSRCAQYRRRKRWPQLI